jgi:hypothetical protein
LRRENEISQEIRNGAGLISFRSYPSIGRASSGPPYEAVPDASYCFAAVTDAKVRALLLEPL